MDMDKKPQTYASIARQAGKQVGREMRRRRLMESQSSGIADRDLLTVMEAAEMLRVSRASLFKLVKDGRLRVVRISARKIFIRVAELVRFLEEAEKTIPEPKSAKRTHGPRQK